MKTQISAYPLRLPKSLKSALAGICREEGTSMNQFIATAVAEKVTTLKTAEFFAAKQETANIEEVRRLLRREGGQPPEPLDRLDAEGGKVDS